MGNLFHRGFGFFRAGPERCRDDHWYRRFYFNGSHWLLIGVLMVSVQALMQGGRGINFQHVLVSWLVFATMFGPSTRVSIEDAYTDKFEWLIMCPSVLLPQVVRFRLLAFKSRDCLKPPFNSRDDGIRLCIQFTVTD